MAYKFTVMGTEHATSAEQGLGWTSALLIAAVDGDGVPRHVRISGALKTDEDIGDAVEKSVASLVAVSPVKTSSLKAG